MGKSNSLKHHFPHHVEIYHSGGISKNSPRKNTRRFTFVKMLSESVPTAKEHKWYIETFGNTEDGLGRWCHAIMPSDHTFDSCEYERTGSSDL